MTFTYCRMVSRPALPHEILISNRRNGVGEAVSVEIRFEIISPVLIR